MIFQGDVIIKTAIELGLEDFKKNPWLIDDMLSDFTSNAYLQDKYGQKQIDACKEWLANNQIDIYLRGRDDKDRLPNVTIQLGPSNEKPEMKTMADQSTETIVLLPNKIGKPIPYVIKPFVPVGYDSDTGIVSTPDNVDLSSIAPGMILVNPANGTGYKILDIDKDGVVIEEGLDIEATQLGVVPQFQYYEARIEHSFFQETYNIDCNAHGDPQNVLFLWSIVKYCILRYRESLLEANGFAESTLNSGDPDLDSSFTTPGGEKAWIRSMSLSGQVENSWIKSPRRIIEVAAAKKKVGNGFIGGIRILSNTDPDLEDKKDVNWYAAPSEDKEDS